MSRTRQYASNRERQAAYRLRKQQAPIRPYWVSPDQRISVYHADCLAVLPSLTLDRAVMVTDPPYGLALGTANNHMQDAWHLAKAGYAHYADTYDQFVRGIVPRLNAYLDHVRVAAVFTGPHQHEQRKPTSIGGIHHPSAVGRTPWGSKNFLPILFYGNPPGAGQHRPTVITSTAVAAPSRHPCPKPLAWMDWLIALASVPDDLIIDPFMGSGMTGIACIRQGRRFIGIDTDQEYCTLAVDGLEDALAQGRLAFDDGCQAEQLRLN
jgi:DNA modification methylase